ncbi:uncharacterized protein KY384_000056 [Bacidia gigantensis]|uniref:uncharacterized protein n=1 Tax=Bacidia gigantensis TaxID=2732470 RepID=UPI001D04FA24|nr:uncharacterized protein KY384_000056 [Bacidia gigantensis]KAG8526463.1 hypothetical protein KY384_000056 [Bacidia gigantensis]
MFVSTLALTSLAALSHLSSALPTAQNENTLGLSVAAISARNVPPAVNLSAPRTIPIPGGTYSVEIALPKDPKRLDTAVMSDLLAAFRDLLEQKGDVPMLIDEGIRHGDELRLDMGPNPVLGSDAIKYPVAARVIDFLKDLVDAGDITTEFAFLLMSYTVIPPLASGHLFTITSGEAGIAPAEGVKVSASDTGVASS